MGIRNWVKRKAAAGRDKIKAAPGAAWSVTKKSAAAGRDKIKAAPGAAWSVTKKSAAAGAGAGAVVAGASARTVGSAAKPVFFSKITSVLIVFLFASMGYVSGFPLYISAWIGGKLWSLFNLIAYSVPGLVPIPDFFFSSAAQFTKGAFGALLNAFMGFQVVKTMGRGFIRSLLSISFLWVWISMVFMIVYTGYIPLFGPSPIGLCGLHQTANEMIGAEPVSCDPYELGVRSERLSSGLEESSILNEALGIFEIRTDRGVAFKSNRLETDYILNDDAGSVITDFEPIKNNFYSYVGADSVVAEDITLMGFLKSKTLFIDSGGGENFVNVTLSPYIAENQCTCAGNVACIPLMDETFPNFKAIFSGKEYNTGIVNAWCSEPWICSIPGAEELEMNRFRIKSGQNQQIKCIHDGLAINESKLETRTGRTRYGGLGKPFFVDFGFSYEAEAISTKQLFVIDREIVETQQDPFTYLNIDKKEVVSSSITDGKINFGIGLDQQLDYLVPSYSEDKSPTIVLLGFSIENPRSSKGDVNDLEMNIQIYPDSPHISFVCGAPDFDQNVLKNPCSVNDNKFSGNFEFKGNADNYYKFELSPHRIDSDRVLNDNTELYYLTMFVNSEILSGSLYQGIFVQAELDYEFETTIETDFRITPTSASNT